MRFRLSGNFLIFLYFRKISVFLFFRYRCNQIGYNKKENHSQ
uniref:Uncharacterized protein n=1 Tax=Myoviridae sp. ctqfO1 TaxID=2827710 RepID=A0A8S5T2H9_9CAUD|nr:MAG TPA: hypothetical protein [Myoviridae sp. ctqfO1]